MTDDLNNQRQLAIKVANSSDEIERLALLAWAEELLKIRESSLPARKKAKAAIQLTTKSKAIWPATKLVGRMVKRLAWDERGTKSRFGLIGVGIGATVFGGQGAGIAALGTAIGVPLWVVLGAGGAFAGMLIEELSGKSKNTDETHKTTYSVIDAERKDE